MGKGMPLVTILTDVDALIEKKKEVCQGVHDAVKSLGKPDRYITVALTKADYITVGGAEASVVVEVDSIGGDFNALIGAIAESLDAIAGVPAEKVVGTFRSVN